MSLPLAGNENKLFKVIIIGDPNVGKTTLTYKFCEGEYLANSEATIGVDFRSKMLNIDGEQITLFETSALQDSETGNINGIFETLAHKLKNHRMFFDDTERRKLRGTFVNEPQQSKTEPQIPAVQQMRVVLEIQVGYEKPGKGLHCDCDLPHFLLRRKIPDRRRYRWKNIVNLAMRECGTFEIQKDGVDDAKNKRQQRDRASCDSETRKRHTPTGYFVRAVQQAVLRLHCVQLSQI
ncbi:unnamed protein product [Brassicogethes aeneus]|uniref:Uncharacterized protein n=1 Tax=Brassicogethes aeneus TaxID=1431903 RepID=A0A9P0BCU5_BRAAE|nr:unnamed protein product [Brassicogethes aeneus]